MAAFIVGMLITGLGKIPSTRMAAILMTSIRNWSIQVKHLDVDR